MLLAAAPLPLRLDHGGGLSVRGRRRLRGSLRRVILGGLADAPDVKFADILLADVLTSYARVLADLYVVLAIYLRQGGSATAAPLRTSGSTAVVIPLILAAPSAMRLRQCLLEYAYIRRSPRRSTGWGGQHLANAVKYATAFPVVILGALNDHRHQSSPGRVWLAAALANTLYGFYWDVAKDWDLTLLSASPKRERAAAVAQDRPFGLRLVRAFRPVAVYYAAVAGDLALRCGWALRLSTWLAARVGGAESVLFMVELLEALRRWVWVFFRLETEWVRCQSAGGPDILLGNYKDDDSESN